jgi:4-diphosphocytidyl-2C-methyl-D-erythritol kinase
MFLEAVGHYISTDVAFFIGMQNIFAQGGA